MTGTFDPTKHCGAARRSTGAGPHDQGKAGDPCRKSKGWGTDHLGAGHCKLHLGTTRNGRVEAANEAATAALTKLGVAVDIEPKALLLQMVREAWGNVIFLRERARELGLELVGDVIDAVRDGDSFATYASKEEVRAIVKLYGEWADRAVKYSKLAIDAGIAEAYLRLEQEHVEGLMAAFIASQRVVELTAAQRDAQTREYVSQLRQLEARQPVGAERN